MAWIRPDPADTHGNPLRSAAPGAPGSRWEPLRPTPGLNSDFVNKLQNYGPLRVQKFLDIDWPKVVHSVTKEIFTQEGQEGALSSRPSPTTPIGYGQAKELLFLQYGRLPEGRGKEAFGSTLADYIFTGISARAHTGGDNAHYKVVDNGLWYLLGQYAGPSPGSHSYAYLPPDNAAGRNQTGNVYEALVGLYWLEGQTQALVDLFLTLMDLDQIEYAHWSTPDRKNSTGSLRGAHTLRCSRFAFARAGRTFGYANGCPSPLGMSRGQTQGMVDAGPGGVPVG